MNEDLNFQVEHLTVDSLNLAQKMQINIIVNFAIQTL